VKLFTQELKLLVARYGTLLLTDVCLAGARARLTDGMFQEIVLNISYARDGVRLQERPDPDISLRNRRWSLGLRRRSTGHSIRVVRRRERKHHFHPLAHLRWKHLGIHEPAVQEAEGWVVARIRGRRDKREFLRGDVGIERKSAARSSCTEGHPRRGSRSSRFGELTSSGHQVARRQHHR
jgi:hypothetical protein